MASIEVGSMLFIIYRTFGDSSCTEYNDEKLDMKTNFSFFRYNFAGSLVHEIKDHRISSSLRFLLRSTK